MHIIIVAIMVAVVCVIGMMLQRIYQGPTVYDRMNGLPIYSVRYDPVDHSVRLSGRTSGNVCGYCNVLRTDRFCRFSDHSEISGR